MNIVSNNIVSNEGKPHTNLHIESIIHHGEAIEHDYKLKPQDSIIFITNKIALMQRNQIGLLFEKKILWEKGLIMNCTRIVHPDYKGHISGLLTNISNKTRLVHIGDKILDLLILQNETQFNKFPDHLKKSSGEYKKNLKSLSMEFPESFLDISSTEKKLDKKIKSSQIFGFWKTLTFLLTMLVGIGGSMVFLEYMAHQRVSHYINSINSTKDLKNNIGINRDKKRQY